MDMSIADKTEIPNELNTSITLELGDIIEVISPANDALHENSLYIKYIDNKHIRLINIASLKEVQLNIDEAGNLTDESIIQIEAKIRDMRAKTIYYPKHGLQFMLAEKYPRPSPEK
jgi:hypothetical protein